MDDLARHLEDASTSSFQSEKDRGSSSSSRKSVFFRRSYFSFLFGIVSIALSLGWGKFVGKEAYFPLTDYVDVAIGCLVGAYLLFLFYWDVRSSHAGSQPIPQKA
jgi:hypothetical protein